MSSPGFPCQSRNSKIASFCVEQMKRPTELPSYFTKLIKHHHYYGVSRVIHLLHVTQDHQHQLNTHTCSAINQLACWLVGKTSFLYGIQNIEPLLMLSHLGRHVHCTLYRYKYKFKYTPTPSQPSISLHVGHWTSFLRVHVWSSKY